jgi:hypothetical protein
MSPATGIDHARLTLMSFKQEIILVVIVLIALALGAAVCLALALT